LGVELWGAFKNVIALACGVSDGLGQVSGLGGDNLKAAIFTAGFTEGCRLLERLGADPGTALSPAGIGDLFVTATSPHGRNRRTGELLGTGQALDEALGSTVMVSEGVRATRMFANRARAENLTAPFVGTVLQLLDAELSAEDCVRQLIA
jgi:glycerol-3-phosphate dehydrogenase (NAD(P)+)